jgi:hypothetical protein
VLFRELGDEAVLVHLGDNRIFELNASGAHIWLRLSRGDSPDTIVTALVDRFEVQPDVARRDLHELLDRLTREGLVSP